MIVSYVQEPTYESLIKKSGTMFEEYNAQNRWKMHFFKICSHPLFGTGIALASQASAKFSMRLAGWERGLCMSV